MEPVMIATPAAAAEQKRPHIFYGWAVVAAAFVVTCVGFGCVYSFTAFVESLQHDFGAARSSVSVIFSLAGFLYFCLGGISGPLADRFGSRRLAFIGMILIAVGLALASLAPNMITVYAAYGLGVGLGVGCSYVPAMGAVQRWFVKRRGAASGIASSGIGVGTLVIPPLAEFFIRSVGWRDAYLVLAGLAITVGAGMALLLENDPSVRGLHPDGATMEATAQPISPHGASIKEAVGSRRFIGLYAACLACSLAAFVPFVHLTPYAIDHGIARSSAVLLVSVIGIGSTVGRFFVGSLADRLGRSLALAATYAGMALALVVWLSSTSFWLLALFAMFFGIAYGSWVALLPAVVMDYFGGRNVSGLIGILYTSAGIGTLIGPSAAGFAFDYSHSYVLPITVGILANVVAAAVATVTSTSRG
jgi:MFS transporter, OFA family, oxalate/formate antiporter